MKLPNSLLNTSMANTGKERKSIKRGAGKRSVDSKSLRLTDEVRSIQRRAAGYDGRVVTVGQLILFSTETGAAWLLDPADQLLGWPVMETPNPSTSRKLIPPSR